MVESWQNYIFVIQCAHWIWLSFAEKNVTVDPPSKKENGSDEDTQPQEEDEEAEEEKDSKPSPIESPEDHNAMEVTTSVVETESSPECSTSPEEQEGKQFVHLTVKDLIFICSI